MRSAPPPRYRLPRPRPGHLVPVGRAALGRPLDGRPRTNATWSKPGTGHYNPDQAGWWAHQSYRRRAAIVWALPLTLGASTFGWLVNPEATRSAQRLAAWLLIAWGLHVVIHKTRRWQPYKQWTQPIHNAIHGDLEMPRKLNPRSYIRVPRDGAHIHDPDKPIIITLPEDFAWPDGTRRAKLAHKVAEAGGIMADDGQFEAHFEMGVQPRTLTVACNPQPPDLVAFAEVLRFWQEAKPDELVLGVSHAKTPVVRSLASDSPHVLASMGPGGGKTELACALCLQRRLKVDARVIYFDFVKHGASAKWAKGIEGIEVIRHVDVAWQLMIDLYAEVEARCEGYWHHGYDENQREIFIVMDEANRSFDALRKYDKRMRADDKHAPSAIDAYEGIVHVGREADTRMVVFGQRGSAKGTGGGDARDAFGIILASRFRPNTARMLFPEVEKLRAPTWPGRFQVIAGGRAEEAQGALMINSKTKALLPEPTELVEQIAAGVVSSARPAVSAVPDAAMATVTALSSRTVTLEPGDDAAEVLEAELVDEAPVAPEKVDLRTAAERLAKRWPNATVSALRNYRGKPETKAEFPQPVGQDGDTFLYDLAEVDRFLANRPRRSI